MKFIEVKNNDDAPIQLSYDDYGKGKPVLLIHGWPSSKEMWEYQIEPLVEAGMRVVTYDRRGFGKSDRPWDGYNYDTLATDLRNVIEQLDLEDITLVGFSMGGGEVARYFSKYGGARVSKAVLVSTVLPFLAKADDNKDGITQDKSVEMIESLANDRIGFLDGFGKQFFGAGMLSHPLSTPLLNYFGMLASVASPRATMECMKAFGSTDFREDTPKIDVPTLIIHGSEDKIVPIEISSDKSSKLVPHNQYLVYDGAPHGLFYTHRDRLNNDLIEFITTGEVRNDTADTILVPGDERIVTINPLGI
jgi:pimeloyl-ACP methyl ester carboxylesterase